MHWGTNSFWHLMLTSLLHESIQIFKVRAIDKIDECRSHVNIGTKCQTLMHTKSRTFHSNILIFKDKLWLQTSYCLPKATWSVTLKFNTHNRTTSNKKGKNSSHNYFTLERNSFPTCNTKYECPHPHNSMKHVAHYNFNFTSLKMYVKESYRIYFGRNY